MKPTPNDVNVKLHSSVASLIFQISESKVKVNAFYMYVPTLLVRERHRMRFK